MQEVVAIDFESTGSSPGYRNTPWQIGMVLLRDGRLCPEQQFSSLLRVPEEQPFNLYTPGRWASLRKELALAPTLPELWPTLQTWFSGRLLLAHNVPVERALLRAFFPFHNLGPWLDSLVLARLAFPGQVSYKLEDLCANLGLSEALAELCGDATAHDALYDAMACASLLQLILQEPSWRQAGLEQLSNLKAGHSHNKL
jgi:DNA polymerase III epsilon subunit-like protein